MSEPQTSNGAISVTRFPENGTQLVETWVLSSMHLSDSLTEGPVADSEGYYVGSDEDGSSEDDDSDE